MAEQILDGTGSNYRAKVDSNKRIWVDAKHTSAQHAVSANKQLAFQVIGTATLSSGTVVALHIKNTDANRNMVLSYIRHQIIDPSGGTTFPNVSNYFSIRLNRTYSSGGSAVVPVNMYAGSANLASATIYADNPTLAGTAGEFDRWYTKSECDMNTFNKEGSLVIPPNGNIEFSYIGDQTGGTIYVRASFYYEEIE